MKTPQLIFYIYEFFVLLLPILQPSSVNLLVYGHAPCLMPTDSLIPACQTVSWTPGGGLKTALANSSSCRLISIYINSTVKCLWYCKKCWLSPGIYFTLVNFYFTFGAAKRLDLLFPSRALNGLLLTTNYVPVCRLELMKVGRTAIPILCPVDGHSLYKYCSLPRGWIQEIKRI